VVTSPRLAGLLTLAASLGAGELAAALGSWRSPVIAVADTVIDRAPEAVVKPAIELFGTADKAVLLATTLVILVLAAPAVVGLVAAGRRNVAIASAAAVALLGAWLATLGRQGTGPSAIPALIAGAMFISALIVMARRVQPSTDLDNRPSVDAAIVAEPMTARRIPTTMLDRRQVLASSVVAIGGGLGGRLLASNRSKVDRSAIVVPPASKKLSVATVGVGEIGVPGVSPFITANRDFYRIDTALFVPQVDPKTWRLRISGAVDKPLEFTYDELLARPLTEHVATMLCVSNEVGGDLVGTASWRGVMLADLLREAGVKPEGTQVFSTSVDGWTCGFPTALALDGRAAMVAVAMNGEPLPVRHGFPARLIVPGLYGYVSSTKWLRDIELNDWESNDGYWMPRGWSKEGPVKPHSRIDTPRAGARVAAGPVAIGGVAWANHRGVGAVQVRVDGGEWQDAKVGDGLNDDTWRQWSYIWDATTQTGRHDLQVRVQTKDGEWQTGDIAPVAPDGATGWHTVGVAVV
jgi:DMSO/TMAO reductase YedYZ molybdopterin-dependent catalytic subunit